LFQDDPDKPTTSSGEYSKKRKVELCWHFSQCYKKRPDFLLKGSSDQFSHWLVFVLIKVEKNAIVGNLL
jgi:hypothetical protein